MATDQEKNLVVLSDHIKYLAKKQQTAVDQITGANRSIVDPARNIEDTHGMVCLASSLAMSDAEDARRAAGAALIRVSTEFVEKLTASAAQYDITDSDEAGNIDRCGV